MIDKFIEQLSLYSYYYFILNISKYCNQELKTNLIKSNINIIPIVISFFPKFWSFPHNYEYPTAFSLIYFIYCY
jgi:hypothetical protein